MSSERALGSPYVVAAVAVVGLLAGCPAGGSNGTGGECNYDVECDEGDVCARDRSCAPAASVREVITRWTVGGQPATATTCAPHPDLAIEFVGPAIDDALGFAPVPCALGQFVVDKLPARFVEVGLGPEGGPLGRWTIPATGIVTIDLR